MEYLALLYGDESLDAKPGTPEAETEMGRYIAFDEIAGAATKSGAALVPLHMAPAATVRVPPEGGEPVVVDGPFAETTEVVGGYYVFDVESLDEAINLAKQIPAADNGVIELRPVAHYNDEDGTDGTGVRFLATIFGAEGATTPGTPEWDAMGEKHGIFMEKNATSITGGVALQATTTATTVRNRDGETIVTDGPFAETAEVVGGYYVLRAATAADAVEIAREIPTTPGGGIELRPIWEVEEM